jgi:hypothetical protein
MGSSLFLAWLLKCVSPKWITRLLIARWILLLLALIAAVMFFYYDPLPFVS